MKKSLILSLAGVFALVGVAVAGGAYSAISVPAPGLWSPPIEGVAKVLQVNVAGSTVATGTVILSSVSANYAMTNVLITSTCSDGKVSDSSTFTNVYLMAGDKLLRTGTATDGTCKIVVAQ